MPKKIFLSYSSRDRAVAEAFVSSLKAAQPGLEIFFDQQALTLGSFWMSALHREIEQAGAFVFLFGERLGPWQALEYYAAMDRRVKSAALPIAVVLMGQAQAPGLPFFNQLHWIKCDTPLAPEVGAKVIAALEITAATPAHELWQMVNPYRGLQALREEDAALLHGRDALLAEVLKQCANAKKALVAVGNSGVGKSSLFNAGVFASLARQGWRNASADPWPSALGESRRWFRCAFKPGEQPLRELARAFVGQWHDPKAAQFHADVEAWMGRFSEAHAPIDEIVHASDRSAEEQGGQPPPRYVIYVDQAEELYTRSDPRSAARLSEILAQASASERVCVLASLRSDFYGHLQDDRALFANAEKIDVPRLDQSGFEAVVKEPARALGAAFEEGLADELVRAAMAAPVGLPLLSYQLTEIWREMIARNDGVLRWPRRRDPAFDLARALVQNADGYLKLHPEREDAVRRLFCVRLIHVPDQGAPTRRVALQSELEPVEVEVAQDLSGADYRLLGAGETDDGRASIEVGHEALLTAWERLKNWIADRRSFYAWLTRAESEAREWQTNAKPDDALLTGRALDRACGYAASFERDIAAPVRAFVTASEAYRRRADRRGAYAEVFMVALVVALAVGGYVLSAVWATSTRQAFVRTLEYDLDSLIAAADVAENGELKVAEDKLSERYAAAFSGSYWTIAKQQGGLVAKSTSLWDQTLRLPTTEIGSGVVTGEVIGPKKQSLRFVARKVTFPPPAGPGDPYLFFVAWEDRDAEAEVAFGSRWILIVTTMIVATLSIVILFGPTGRRFLKRFFPNADLRRSLNDPN